MDIDPYLIYSHRPFRIGFCCERPTAADVLEIASLSFTLWGGRYNPIIDVGKPDEARRIVREFCCDLLFPFHMVDAVNRFISSFPELGWVDFRESLVDTSGDEQVPIFLDILTCARNFVRVGEGPHWLRIPPAHPAFSALAITFGTLPSVGARMPLDYPELMQRRWHPPLDLDGDAEPAEPTLKLSELCTRGIVQRPFRWDSGVLVGDSNQGHVLRQFWNTFAAGYSAVLFDPNKSEASGPWLTRHIERFRSSRIEKPSHYHVWSELSHPAELPEELRDYLSPLAAHVVLAPFNTATANLFGGSSSTHGAEQKSALPRVGTRRSRATVEFLPEVPKRLWLSMAAGHFMLEVKGSTHADGPQSVSFRPPHFPRANREFARTLGIVERDRLRTQIDGFSVIFEPTARPLRIKGALGEELLRDSFKGAGIEATLSDKGKYADRLVRFMGGLQKCRAFKIPGVRRLFDQTSHNEAITTPHATRTVRGENGDATEIDRFKDLVLQAGQGYPLTSAMVWNFLLRKRVFVPGSELKCEECSLIFWLSIDELRSEVACIYCGAALIVGPLLKSNLDWKYRRSHLFTVDASLHGTLPVIMTLQLLHTHFPTDTIAWSTSLNLELPDGTRCETDLAIATAHTLQPSCLLIGECKTNQPFDNNDLRNLLLVQQRYEDSPVDAYVVFAKSARFTEEELQLIRDQPPLVRSKLLLLDIDQLERYEAFPGERGGTGDMARLARASAAAFGY